MAQSDELAKPLVTPDPKMAKGWTMRWKAPVLRVDRERRIEPEKDHLKGQITIQEKLWGVIVTMSIMSMRNQIFKDHGDILWYVLNFFCLYDVVMASIMYSCRFNDIDLFHRILWAFFTLGMAGQAAFMNMDERWLAMCTGFLYVLVSIGLLRVAIYMPKERFLALHDTFFNLSAASVLAAIAWNGEFTLTLLGIHALIRPLSFLSFWFFTRTQELKEQRDVPVNIWYLISRFEGLYMMIICCSVMAPLALEGTKFLVSWEVVAVVVLGNLYGLLAKISLVHVTQRDGPEHLKFHAIRYGSRARALLFLLLFPYGVLGLAITGVGIVSVIKGEHQPLPWIMMCGGACFTWMMVTLSQSCHHDISPKVHRARLLLQFVAAAAFLGPWVLGLGGLATVCWLTTEMAVLLALQVVLERFRLGKWPEGWLWRGPRLLTKRGERGTMLAEVPGSEVSSHEGYFTVLLSVAIYMLNRDLAIDHDLVRYLYSLVISYYAIWSSVRYAARFKDEDLSHKVVWCLFEMTLLVAMEGLSATRTDASENHFSLGAACLFLMLAVCFSGRAVLNIRDARRFSGVWCAAHLCAASLLFAAYKFPMWRRELSSVVALMLLLSDAIGSLLFTLKRDWAMPMNHTYLVNRIDGMYMEVLGVAVIMPDALFPGLFDWWWLVFACDVLAVKLAVSIKHAIFYTEPLEYKRHAVNQGPLWGWLYATSVFVTILGMSFIGATIPAIVKSVGSAGLEGSDRFVQAVLCSGSALFWISMALAKAAHRFNTCERVHKKKVLVKAATAALCFLPLALDLGDFGALCLVVGLAQTAEWGQEAMDVISTRRAA